MAAVKIETVNIWSFNLKLARKLNLAGEKHKRRHGLLVQLIGEDGHVGWGEISPLPGFSGETPVEAFSQLNSVRKKIIGMELPMPSENEIGMARISMLSNSLSEFPLAPSVRFGLDSAWLMALGNERGVSMAEMLHPNPLKSISVNALLYGSKKEVSSQVRESLEKGFRSFKLKLGRQPLSDDIAIVQSVRQQIGDASLRLDCNRAWTVAETFSFWEEVADCGIEYIEEPLKEVNDYKSLFPAQEEGDELPPLNRHALSPDEGDELTYLERHESLSLKGDELPPLKGHELPPLKGHELPPGKERGFPLALDESLTSMSPEEILAVPNLKALIIKPTILSFVVAALYAMLARGNSLTPVISSSFESSVGLTALAQMAAAFNETDVPVGLDTLGWMADDLLTDPMKIQNGNILISDLPDIRNSIRRDLLTLVTPNDD